MNFFLSCYHKWLQLLQSQLYFYYTPCLGKKTHLILQTFTTINKLHFTHTQCCVLLIPSYLAHKFICVHLQFQWSLTRDPWEFLQCISWRRKEICRQPLHRCAAVSSRYGIQVETGECSGSIQSQSRRCSNGRYRKPLIPGQEHSLRAVQR